MHFNSLACCIKTAHLAHEFVLCGWALPWSPPYQYWGGWEGQVGRRWYPGPFFQVGHRGHGS